MGIQFNENSEELGQSARTALSSLLADNYRRPILLLCSGGSAFELLHGIPKETLGPHITIGTLDERYSTDETINNFAQLQKTDFYKTAIRAGAHIIDTRPNEEETIDELARRFEHELRVWRTSNPDGVIIATQGIGPDGHTAGIMPFPEDPARFRELFESPNVWVYGYDAGEKNQYPLRATTTITFLKKIDHSIVYCVGENKREALSRVFSKEGTHAETPARILREMKNVVIFTDIF